MFLIWGKEIIIKNIFHFLLSETLATNMTMRVRVRNKGAAVARSASWMIDVVWYVTHILAHKNNPKITQITSKLLYSKQVSKLYENSYNISFHTAIFKRGLDTISPAMSLRRLHGVPFTGYPTATSSRHPTESCCDSQNKIS